VATREKVSPSSSEGCTANLSGPFIFSAAPACPQWAFLVQSSRISSGMPFPLSYSQPDPQIFPSQGLSSLPLATSPGSCRPEGTAVSAVSDSAASAASKVAVKRLRRRFPGC